MPRTTTRRSRTSSLLAWVVSVRYFTQSFHDDHDQLTMAMMIDQHGRQARLGFILATTLYNLGHVVYLWILLVQSAPHFISRVMMIAVIIKVNNVI